MRDTVFITGNAGMIGSHIADRLADDFHLVGLDDFSGGRIQNVHPIVNGFKGSCLNVELVETIFAHHSPRFVIHCAAMAAENLSHNCRRFTYQNNLLGETTIRNAAIKHGTECMISLSSIAVMGHQEPPFTEETPPAPADPYGISKYAGEMDARTTKEFFGLNYIIFRPHNVIGTRQNMSDRYRNVAAIFARAIKEGRPLPIFGNGHQTRAFSPVSYVSEVIAASIERPGTWNEIYNVGSDEPLTILQLKSLFEDIVDCSLTAEFHPHRQEAIHAHMRHDKVCAMFPTIRPTERVEDVLRAMLDETNQTGAIRPMQKGPEIEITKNLPTAWAQFA